MFRILVFRNQPVNVNGINNANIGMARLVVAASTPARQSVPHINNTCML